MTRSQFENDVADRLSALAEVAPTEPIRPLSVGGRPPTVGSSKRLALVGAAVFALVVGGIIVSGRQPSLTDVTVPPVDSTTTALTTTPVETTAPNSTTDSNPTSVPTGGTLAVDGFDTIPAPDGTPLPTNGVAIWTGSELVLWGGESRLDSVPPAMDPGLAYDIEADRWRELAPGPLSPRLGVAGVWTGTEVIICCGDGSQQAAAYEPSRDRWRAIADSPIVSQYMEAVWTGDQMLLTTEDDAASYDPTTDVWRVLERPPSTLDRLREMVWMDDELIVWPAEVGRRVSSPMALDPVAGTWRVLPDPPAWPAAPDIVWTGKVLVAWGGLPASAAVSERAVGSVYDPDTDSWVAMPEFLPEPRPFEGNLGSQSLLWTGETVLVNTGAFASGLSDELTNDDSYLLSFDPATREWAFVGVAPGYNFGADPVVADQRVVFRGAELFISNDQFGVVADEFVAPEYYRSLHSWVLEKPVELRDRAGHTAVWADGEMIVWGGWSSENATVAFDDGAAYNPVTASWRSLADSPLDGRGFHTAVWTGSEMLVVGGLTDVNNGSSDAAAYERTQDRWRSLPPTGLTPSPTNPTRVRSVWTGTELVLWDAEADEMEAFSPATNSWTRLPSPGLGPSDTESLFWVDGELVVLSADFSRQQARYAAASLPSGAANWTRLPDPPVGEFGAVSGDRILAWDIGGIEGGTFELDVRSRVWSEAESIPLPPCEGQSAPMTIDDRIFVTMACLNDRRVDGGAVLYDPDTRAWEILDVGIEGVAGLEQAVWTGREVLTFKPCCYGTGGRPFTWRGIRYLLPE